MENNANEIKKESADKMLNKMVLDQRWLPLKWMTMNVSVFFRFLF